ncbi:hypothetical protein RUM44_003811 [Polyplax serrata]|uniref:Nucleolar protein 16 n=1 Tax=Polyplax serrata TaxID=468196 RepID=A0ABR1B158_POLSC
MTKIRKQKKRKTYQYNVNRKRLQKKQFSGGHREIMKNDLNLFTSNRKNFKKNGLVYDVNQDIKSLNKQRKEHDSNTSDAKPTTNLVSRLEQTASVVRHKQTNLSKDQMEYLSYMVENYGDNYKAMAKDRRNYLQHTWKQLRNKVKAYKIILGRNTNK